MSTSATGSRSALPGFPTPGASNAFNTTVDVTVDSWSGLVDVESPPWDVGDNGDRKSPLLKATTDAALPRLNLFFVGVGYTLHGTGEWVDGGGPSDSSPSPAHNILRTIQNGTKATDNIKNFWADDNTLGSASRLSLAWYNLEVTYGQGAQLTFQNATVQIPMRTQAPDFGRLRQQSTFTAVVKGSTLSPDVSARVPLSMDDLRAVEYQWYFPDSLTFADSSQDSVYSIIDDYALLQNSTEIAYRIPRNTTLVEVVGPTGAENGWLACYAMLEPKPSWWIEGNIPVAQTNKPRNSADPQTNKPRNSADQSLFLLPIDPTVHHTVRVGSLGQGRPCAISGFRTYPFHYDFERTTDDHSSGTNTTPIIVGVVVGVVGGLIVLALALYYFRCKHKKHEEARRALLPEPYDSDAVSWELLKAAPPVLRRRDRRESAPSSEPVPRQESGDDHEEQTGQLEPDEFGHEEPGSEDAELLPPIYRDHWQMRFPPPSVPRLVRSPSPSSRPTTPQPSDATNQSSSSHPELAQPEPTRPPPQEWRPPLKEDYMRAFNWMPAPEQGGLHEDYKRVFCLSSSSVNRTEQKD